MKPYMEVSVGAPVEGIIEQVAVDRGDWVSKGQAVVTLEASVEQATASLKLHTIHSPLSGVLVERLLSPGELAKHQPIFKLAQIDPLRIEVFAPVSLLGKLEPGMKADVRPEGSASRTYQAEITVVNRVVDSASGTFGVRLEMPNPNHALPAGLVCTVKFPVMP